ncbi:MAG: hypothetical protein KGL19_14255 [Bacteroidota bacterium]|nr:hypothetical protein [Bacteroidota bacterium]
MRVILITGSIAAMPVLKWLQQQQLLCGVAMQDVLATANPALVQWVKQQSPASIVINRAFITNGLAQWLQTCKPDIVLVYGFSWILPPQILLLSRLGFFNIHFSLLPAYKGPAPVFWQLKNGEKTTGISIHQMTEKPDAGKTVFQMSVDILPGETLGLLTMRLAQLSVHAISHFFEQNCFKDAATAVSDSTVSSSYQHRPEIKDLLVEWKTMNAFTIENLVNAANPLYSGAICFFRGQELRLLEVSTAKMNTDEKHPQAGLLIKADGNKAVVIQCIDSSYLKIKIAGTAAGIYSAEKWIQFSDITEGELLQ